MKVVQVLPRLSGGGVERGAIEIACYLKKFGHEAIVVSEGGRLVHELENIGVTHVIKPVGTKSLRTLRGVSQLKTYFTETCPDIVHSRSRLPHWLCYHAIKRLPEQCRPRFVTSVQGLHSVSWYSSSITKGERIEVVSGAAKDYLLKNYIHVDPSRIRVIHRGVDPRQYHPQFEPDCGWKGAWSRWCTKHRIEKQPIVSIVGRISRLKGHHEYLDVIESLHEVNIPVVALIVGATSEARGKLHDELQHRVNRSEVLSKSVSFLGHRDDVRELMKVSDVVVSLSSTPEAFGRTVLEALSLGVPVVGYDHGGVGEILDTIFPIGAVPVGDTQAAAERIKHLLTHEYPISTHSMTLEAMSEKTITMYEELLHS